MIRHSRPPLLLAKPSRYAGVATPTARLLLALLTCLTVLSWVALALPAMAADGIGLDGALIDAVRHGGGYYAVAADALHADGASPDAAAAIRLPTLALVEGGLPAIAAPVLLGLLTAGAAVAWLRRLHPAFRRPQALWGAAVLFVAGAVAAWRADAASTHEVWAGLLVALSLARRAPERWIESLGWGLLAALVHETAAVYILVMLCFASRDGGRREAAAWAAALVVVALTVAAHLFALDRIAGAVFPSELALTPDLGAPVRAWRDATALALVPPVLAGPLLALALAGWTAWRDGLAIRVAGTLAGAALLAALGSPGAGLLTAPVLLVGLAFALDGLRDLAGAALDRRRITVRRVMP